MTAIASVTAAKPGERKLLRFVRRNPTLTLGIGLFAAIALAAILAPLFPGDPVTMQPARRFAPAGGEFLLGTDALGRDVLARTVHGARVSLSVGLSVAAAAVIGGLILGLIAGYVRPAEAVIMRVMDGLMAIPTILLAIALMSLTQASITTVIIAIAVPESRAA
jgi:peptide/nickel transport system permease protein